MPGKGGLRSKSTPRERPSGARPGSASRQSPASPGMRPPSASRERASPVRRHSPSVCSVHDSPRDAPFVNRLNMSGTGGGISTFGQEKCVCSICTCGRHHCPVQPKTQISFGDSGPHSTTSMDYANHDPRHYKLGMMRPSQQRAYSPSLDRFDHATTHQAAYTWNDPSPNRMERSVPPTLVHTSIHTPDSRMDLTTMYKSNFVEHSIPSRSMRPATPVYEYGSPRDLSTTHQNDYLGKQHQRCPATVLPARPASARSGHVKYNLDNTGTWS